MMLLICWTRVKEISAEAEPRFSLPFPVTRNHQGVCHLVWNGIRRASTRCLALR
ncbi:hypothetical protein KC19_12G175400 [Ceratodon purpureus]|uniref:Uncharacterized protein n=1 Tax=Ceratodon purpureus TaxID=3225 RepID=A0A8T0G8C2_CERPU|nr:hypothetical protein KC19_12G175400 [Ceratodon purpureus]